LTPYSVGVVPVEGVARREYRFIVSLDGPGSAVVEAHWYWRGELVYTVIVEITLVEG
jgi:hypothetical protein